MQTPRWCLGTLTFGTTVDERRSYALLDRYVDAGGEWLDTANNYAFWVEGATGDESELLLGRWLASRRRSVVLATKIGARPRPGSTGFDAMTGLSGSAVRDQVHGSLRRLGVDRLDVVYAHVDDRATPLAETLAAFDELVAEGLVGAVACSNYTVERLAAAPRYEAVQLRATYLTSRPEADFTPQVELADGHLALAAERGIPVFGFGSLLAGAYAGRPVPEAYRHDRTDAQLLAVREAAGRLGVTTIQVALGWLLARGVVPVLGVSRVEQLEEAMTADRLDPAEVEALDAARRED